MQQLDHFSANVSVSETHCMQKTTCLCHLQDIHMTLTPTQFAGCEEEQMKCFLDFFFFLNHSSYYNCLTIIK